MQCVTISPKYQIVIPKVIRESLQLKPGQRIQIMEYEDRIELFPEKPIAQFEGFLKGIDPSFEREQDRV